MDNTEKSSALPSAHNKWSKYVLALFIALFIVLIIWCVCIIVGSMGTVKNITVQGESIYSDEHIIAACGLELGMKNKQVDTKASEKMILKFLPCISSSTVKKKLGGNVIICVTSENIKYSSNISNEYFVMSDSFKVLYASGTVAPENIPLEISLPDIKQAIVGEEIKFYDDISYINEFIGILEESDLNAGITFIDFSNKYALELVYKNKYSVRFGSLDNVDLKLQKIYLIMDDIALTEETKAIIDVSDISHPTVKVLS